MGFSFRITDLRPDPFKNALAVFKVAFGIEDADGKFRGLFQVTECVLKSKKDGGVWVQPPARKRLNKDGSAVQKDGYDVYDSYFDLYKADGEGKNGAYGAPQSAWDFWKELTTEADKAYRAAKGTPVTKPEGVKAGVDAKNVGSPLDEFEGLEDDDLPF